MATIRAAANGNWSAGATWIGGVVPTSADDVVANSFTVQIDGTYTVLSARNDTTGGATAGGTFAFTNNSSLTCTAPQAIYVGSTTPVLTFALASGNTATFNGNILTITWGNGYRAILQSNTGTLNCVGNYNLDGFNANTKCIIQSTAAGVLNILGNVTNTMITGGHANATIISSGGATINITAPVFSGGGAPNNTYINALLVSNGGNVTLTGNPVANICPAINILGGSLTIIGNPQGSSTAPAVLNINSACTMNVVGTPTAGSGANAIVGLGLVRVTGNPINTSRFMAIYAPQVTIDATTNSWTFQQFAGGDITLYASGASLGNPVQADVRFGTTYGPSGTLTGTLRVPNPNTVLLGVLTDNTTGTLLMTPQQFWEALTSAVTLVGSFGKLIKDFLNAAVGSIPTNPVLDTDSRLNYLDAPISGVGGSVDLTPVLDAIADIPTNPLLDDDVRVDDIKERTDKIPDYPASVQSTGEQIASYQT